MITIIPAIDIIDGKCVRLTEGNYDTKKVYNEDPLEVARTFEELGIKRLHLVDLEGAKGDSIVNLNVLESIASKTQLVIDFGGGIKSKQELGKVFNAGAKYATIGSLAVKNMDLVSDWINEYKPEKFLIGIDTYDGIIKTRGWKESSEITVDEIITFYSKLEIKRFMLTDISKDGKLEGLDLAYYKYVRKKYPDIHLIASGGVSSLQDIEALDTMKIDGVVVGKAIYENVIEMNDLKKYL